MGISEWESNLILSNEKFMCADVANVSVCPKLIWMNDTRIRLKFKGRCLKQENTAPFISNYIVNLFIVYEFDRWGLNYWLSWLKLTKNADPDKYKYRGYGIGFDSRSEFLFADGRYGKNVIILGMSSFVHVDNKGKDILILSEKPTEELDDTTLTAEAKYLIDFSKSQGKFCLSLQYNGNNSFVFVNATKICQFKANDSKIKKYPLHLGNISRDFMPNHMKKNGIKWICLRIFCWL